MCASPAVSLWRKRRAWNSSSVSATPGSQSRSRRAGHSTSAPWIQGSVASSGEVQRNKLANLDVLNARDQLKFVLCSRADYEWARDLLRARAEPLPAQVLFSPVWGEVAPRDLAEWILADRLAVRLQVQLHKVLWGNEPGR
jgi:organic radical activating enzyme